jgi:hypothetical protein
MLVPPLAGRLKVMGLQRPMANWPFCTALWSRGMDALLMDRSCLCATRADRFLHHRAAALNANAFPYGS